MWQRVRSTMSCLFPHLTPTTELVEAHREEASVWVELGVGGGVDKIFAKKYVKQKSWIIYRAYLPPGKSK